MRTIRRTVIAAVAAAALTVAGAATFAAGPDMHFHGHAQATGNMFHHG